MSNTERKFSAQRLENIRRLRKARRIFKQEPLFAFERMTTEIPGYSYEQFLDDLRRRGKKQVKKKKSTATRYGRFTAIREYMERYHSTGDERFAMKAIQLRKNLTKPYRILVRFDRESIEFSLSEMIPFRLIVELNAKINNDCKSMEQAKVLIDELRKWH